MTIDLSDQDVIERVAIALHQATWKQTIPWEYDIPKMQDHYRDQVRVVFNELSRIGSEEGENQDG